MIKKSVFDHRKETIDLKTRKKLYTSFEDITKIYKMRLSDLNCVNLFMCKSQKTAENVYFNDCLLLR